MIFDDNLDFEKFSAASAFAAFVKHQKSEFPEKRFFSALAMN